MAINEPIKEISLRLKKEITSKNTKLKRIVSKNEATGYYEPQYPIEIDIEAITYELDANDNKIDIYEYQELGNVSLSGEEILSLWMEPITLADGTATVLGEVLATKIDQIIQAKIQ